MIDVGRICIKTAGRDASKKCIVIDKIDNNFVLIDGETRRKKCNIKHLEPLADVVKIKKNASHEEVSKILKELGITVRETKPKEKKEKPRKKRKIKEQEVEEKIEKKRRKEKKTKKKESKEDKKEVKK